MMPFGGKQVIIAGDFYQLPPVLPFRCCLYCGLELDGFKGRLMTFKCKKHGEFYDHQKWAFQSPVWKACQFATVELKQVHRQSDPVSTDILHRGRLGLPWTTEQQDILLNHPHEVIREKATKVLPIRRKVNEINSKHMAKLESQSRTYSAVDHFLWNDEKHPELEHYHTRVGDGEPQSALNELDRSHRYDFEIELKFGMLVILTRNLSKSLVNGSMGTIVGFLDMKQENMPRAQDGIDDRALHPGQLLMGEHKYYQECRILDFRRQACQPDAKWPLVKFSNGKKRVVFASCLVQECGQDKPYGLLSRTQIPLIPGWAITIHKSQGLTLDSVIVDLDLCFERGQAYVALSRARSLRGLVVQTLPKPQFMGADPVVKEFMQREFGQPLLKMKATKKVSFQSPLTAPSANGSLTIKSERNLLEQKTIERGLS